jgi:hypothetical protein
MNISRYANIDKFVNIRYIFFTSPSGIQLIISASPNVEITSPGRQASGFFNPCSPIHYTLVVTQVVQIHQYGEICLS